MKKYWISDVAYIIEDKYGYIIGAEDEKGGTYHVRIHVRKIKKSKDKFYYYINVHVHRLKNRRERANYMVLRKYDTIELDVYGEEAEKRYKQLEDQIKRIHKEER